MINKICDYIIKTVQEDSQSDLSGFQYSVPFDDVKLEFHVDELDVDAIVCALAEREEVADIEIFDDAFDVMLYTDFAPNYNTEYWAEENQWH